MTAPPYPPGSLNANGFSLCNAVAFQIFLGAPMILFAKSIGATSTVLGLIASFTPLMTIFQLPAAHFLPRFGYRWFMLMGWGARTWFIFGVALVPMLTFIDDTSRIALLLSGLFFFNLLRGISSCAWFPWVTELIPETVRGRFLSRDQVFLHIGCLVALVASAIVMIGKADPWDYSIVFGLSAVAQTASLWFLRRIPDVPAGEATRRSSASVPWFVILTYPPFFTLLIFNLLWVAVVGGLGVFTVEYLESRERMTPSGIMALSTFGFFAALVSLPVVGRFIDRLGGAFVLRVCLSILALVIVGWALIAGGVVAGSWLLIAALNFFSGLAGANFNLANIRLLMGSMPEMGRNHFFALFSVVSSLGLGGAPVVWGVSLDAIGAFEYTTHFFTWGRYSIYFSCILLLCVIAFACVSILRGEREVRGDVRVFEARFRRFGRDWLR